MSTQFRISCPPVFLDAVTMLPHNASLRLSHIEYVAEIASFIYLLLLGRLNVGTILPSRLA